MSRDNRLRKSRFALGPSLADAEDGDQPGAPSGGYFCADGGVGLAAAVAALGMAEDDVTATRIPEHLGANVAGIGPLLRGGAVLAAERDAAAAERIAHPGNQRRRRTDQQIAVERRGLRSRGNVAS